MIKLAIDLGSSMTKIYRADTNSGVVLAEPSCVAATGDEKIKAIGKEAKNLIGKTAEYTNIVYPVYEGEIAHPRFAAAMLKEFLSRIGLKASSIKRAQVLFSVPCGISERTLNDYVALTEECGLKKVWFVEQPYLAALGAGAILSETDPVFCLDIGGGVSNAAVVSADGIIAGISMNVGGNNMDANIIAKLSSNNKLLVGALTAEKIKNEIASLSPGAQGTMVAEGSSIETCQPTAASVQAAEITDCVRVYINKVVEYAVEVLRTLPAEVAATVNRGGVLLSGGIMKIPFVPQYIAAKLGMRYRVCEEPQYATVLGGGVLLRDKALLSHFAKVTDA
ncbi:MAG: hypothetical protein E7380_06585 [Clostridiales bacterium]|nr:hypothetical protein [Clostridiales bacterium]